MFKDLKKVELHLHLDGSIRITTAEEILQQKDLRKEMIVDSNSHSLKDYLTKFNLPISIMQTKDNLTRVSKELMEDLDKDNVIYAEIRFAPNFHTKKGLSLDEVVKAVLAGIQNSKVKANLILCMMRGDSFLANKKIIDLAIKYKNKGVCGIDLAGDEASYPTSLYKDLFNYAIANKVPFTIHAGEAGTLTDIDNAIKYGANRIGHGIKAVEDENLLGTLRKNKIPLEICPTSNVQTHAVSSYQNHPIKKLKDKDILITINTDNRTVSNINLNQEYELLYKYFGFNKEDFIKFNRTAIEYSFLTKEEKEKLQKEIV